MELKPTAYVVLPMEGRLQYDMVSTDMRSSEAGYKLGCLAPLVDVGSIDIQDDVEQLVSCDL